jgi:hypothetical protein
MKESLSVLALISSVSVAACARHVDTAYEMPRASFTPREAHQRYEVTRRHASEGTRHSRLATRAGESCAINEARAETTRRQCALEAERLGKSVTLWCAGL